MNCPECGYQNIPASAKFCPECGAKLLGKSRTAETEIRISQQVEEGNPTGLEINHLDGNVTVVQGNVIHINNPTQEFIEEFSRIRAVRTEIKPGREESMDSQPERGRMAAMEQHIKDILDHVKTLEKRGERVEQVKVGNVHLSRVELLLKQAVLLKAEADQSFLDHVGTARNMHLVDRAKAQSTGPTFQLDLNQLMEGFNEDAYLAKLRMALELLQEANRLDPTNAEVLLHMAQVVDSLEENPQETQRILYKVESLLNPPRNDTEKFHLAQAKFLSAVSGKYKNLDAVGNARDMFAQLGRTDWVKHCELFLQSSQDAQPAAGSQAGFQPVGNWQAQMSNGGSLAFTLFPNGTVQGAQNIGLFGMQVPFNGQWAFNPYNQLLQLQGIVGNLSPFALQIAIQGQQGQGYLGMGSDGLQYYLMRLA